jgi:nucleoside-diphosphate-sugar epimerase
LKKNPKVVEKTPTNVSIRNVSNKKAKEVLDWEPRIDLDEGLKSLITVLT